MHLLTPTGKTNKTAGHPHLNLPSDKMHVRPNPQYSKLLLALSLLTPLVCANWRYKSRPDLSPPTLNITIRHTGSTASQLSPGYLFLAPFSGFSQESAGPGSSVRHGPLQAAPYIFTDRGELVWSGFTYFSSWTTNFQVVRWQGKEVLAAFEGSHNAAYGHGQSVFLFLSFSPSPFVGFFSFTYLKREVLRDMKRIWAVNYSHRNSRFVGYLSVPAKKKAKRKN